MKKTVQKEIHACDKCGRECDYPDVCLNCGAEMCHSCAQKCGVEYPHAVNFSGSDDGFYCNPCDNKLTGSGKNELHAAYRAIQSLRREAEMWRGDFDKRMVVAEAVVKSLCKR